jgi:transcriptional regulator with XRE-family HTH domain
MRMAEVIRTRRVALGLSPAGLAARCGVSADSIIQFEKAEGIEPTRETAIHLADALGLSLEELTEADTTRKRGQWFVERALEIAVETDSVTTIGSAGDARQTTFFLPREPSDAVRQRLRALGAEYGVEVDVELDPDAPESPR